ncbi:MAG: hypothetical protein H0T65_06120 [Deltaproteobacteria bacterium]|nr:hypothetical protein [Deltaproteobacteria bacterium]
MFRLACVISLLPCIAAADDALTSDEVWVQKALTDAVYGDLTSALDTEVHASVSGQAGRQTGGQAIVGGEVAWNVGLCRALLAGGEAAVENEELSGSAWGGFCLPFPMNRFEMVLRTDYQLQPSLASLPVALRARYTGISVEFKNTFVGWSSTEREHAIFPMVISMATFQQGETIDTGRVQFDIDIYRRTTKKTGRILQVLPIGYRAAGPAIPAETGGMYLSSHAAEYSPFKITRTSTGSFGPFAIEADFVAGLAYGSLTDAPEGGQQMAPVRVSGYDLYADAALRATRKDDTFALRLRRAFEPTYTDELLLDTRLDASWFRTHGKHTLLAGAFVANTKRFTKDDTRDTTQSGGLRGAYIYKLPKKTQMMLTGEVARSFYATLDDTLAVDAAWSAQATAAFSFTTRATP